MLETLSYI